MVNKKYTYQLLAELFMYPRTDYIEQVNACNKHLLAQYPEAAISFERFVNYANEKTLFEIEEIFGITFHIQAICFLDLGYVLFGEDYKRGDFLVHMKREMEAINLDCREELSDNLPNVLRLIAVSEKKEFIEELVVRIVIPAITKMLGEFRAARIELKYKVIKKKQKVILLENIENGNIYQNALQALLKVFQKDFAGLQHNDPELSPSLSNVIPNCGSCSTATELLKSTPS